MYAEGGTLRLFAERNKVSTSAVWSVVSKSPAFLQQYAEAKKIRAQQYIAKFEASGERVSTIAERVLPRNTSRILEPQQAQAAIAAERLYQDGLAKLARFNNPEEFGDRQIIEGGSKPIILQHELSPQEHARRMAYLLSSGLKSPQFGPNENDALTRAHEELRPQSDIIDVVPSSEIVVSEPSVRSTPTKKRKPSPSKTQHTKQEKKDGHSEKLPRKKVRVRSGR